MGHPNQNTSEWSPSRVDLLLELAARGMTGREVANELNLRLLTGGQKFTKQSVNSKLKRLKKIKPTAIIRHEFHLRHQDYGPVILHLPADITKREADRLADAIQTFPFGDGNEKQA